MVSDAMAYDDIVVGAGTAGCVIAARLSEDPRRRVLLIEAGEDPTPEPPSIRSPYPISHAVGGFRWPDLTAVLKAPRGRRPAPPPSPFIQGRVMGGGGSLMGMIALRGQPGDYDDWREAGASDWSWDDVLPAFRALERDHDCHGELHGQDGPIPIRRRPREDWSPFAQTLGQVFEADGFPFIADANGDFRDGHLAMPSSNLPDRRISSAAGYLDVRARARPNLAILTGTEVHAIRFAGGRAEGVIVNRPEGPTFLSARRVIICGGAIFSPLLLLRSGIGPADELKAVGVEPVRDRPGVGNNLANHPAIYLSALLPRGARKPRGPFTYNALRYSSGHRDCPDHDMLMPVLNRTTWHALGDSIAALGVCLYRPFSRGRVSLTRRGRDLGPDIDFRFFDDPRDLARMIDGYRRVHRYMEAAREHLPGLEVFAPTSMRLVAKLSEPGMVNAAIGALLAGAFDAPDPIRRLALGRAGVDPAPLLADDEALAQFVYQCASPMYHPTGTCRIGAPDDAGAVVDSRLRVIGTEGLCVADAAVMPSIVRGNTNIPTIMIAEKAAAMFRQDEQP